MTSLYQARADLRARQGAGARYDAATAPAEALGLARRGAAYLARIVNGLDDAALQSVSSREGWSRRRLIAAVALEARKIAQALEDATGNLGDRAETGSSALDLAETLPPRALRHLVSHTQVHLNVVWRDLRDNEWDIGLILTEGPCTARETARLHAETLWRTALDLRAGGRLRDMPLALQDHLSKNNAFNKGEIL